VVKTMDAASSFAWDVFSSFERSLSQEAIIARKERNNFIRP